MSVWGGEEEDGSISAGSARHVGLIFYWGGLSRNFSVS